jgi:hypothetical protein
MRCRIAPQSPARGCKVSGAKGPGTGLARYCSRYKDRHNWWGLTVLYSTLRK